MLTKEQHIKGATDALYDALNAPVFDRFAKVEKAVGHLVVALSPEKPKPVNPCDVFPVASYHIGGEDYVQAKRYKELFTLYGELRMECDKLAQWKKEQLTVKAWWDEIDTYVRKHPDTVIGESVANATHRLLKERDVYALQISSKEDEIAYLTQRASFLQTQQPP